MKHKTRDTLSGISNEIIIFHTELLVEFILNLYQSTLKILITLSVASDENFLLNSIPKFNYRISVIYF